MPFDPRALHPDRHADIATLLNRPPSIHGLPGAAASDPIYRAMLVRRLWDAYYHGAEFRHPGR